jgi:hypothetical protein
VDVSSSMVGKDYVEGRMVYGEEVMDFSDDPLGQWDASQDIDKLHHLGSRPLEEVPMEIPSELVHELGEYGARIS